MIGEKLLITVWNENKAELQTMLVSEETYNKLNKAKETYKKKFDTVQEPYIILDDSNVK